MIAIVDYGAGNITSVKRAVEHLGFACGVTCEVTEIKRAARIIVPGVGNFQATSKLSQNVLGAMLGRQILLGKPLLGICLGMQWLFESSDEAPSVPGLGQFQGRCRTFPAAVKSPHVGWDQLEIDKPGRLLRGISSGEFVYFSHGYCAPVMAHTAAVCGYGKPFAAAVESNNLFGVQFHPEKSGEAGLEILRNFCTC